METEKRVTLKKIKTFEGMDGHGFNADVYFDEKLIAFAFDEGCGGDMFLRFHNPETKKLAEDYAKTLPLPKDWEFMADTGMSLEILINNLIDKKTGE